MTAGPEGPENGSDHNSRWHQCPVLTQQLWEDIKGQGRVLWEVAVPIMEMLGQSVLRYTEELRLNITRSPTSRGSSEVQGQEHSSEQNCSWLAWGVEQEEARDGAALKASRALLSGWQWYPPQSWRQKISPDNAKCALEKLNCLFL